jgi:hypothetical protein
MFIDDNAANVARFRVNLDFNWHGYRAVDFLAGNLAI